MVWALAVLAFLFLAATSLAFPSSVFDSVTAPPRFDSQAQYIDVTGAHEYVPPGPSDERGPCPGLNSLANHNFIEHDGFVTYQSAVEASSRVFGFDYDAAMFAANLAQVFGGDADPSPPGLQFSIGGPPQQKMLSGLLGLDPPSGLSYTRNKFECDSSVTRGDFNQFNEDAYHLQLPYFEGLYRLQPESGANYNKPVLFEHRAARFQQSIDENPFFFWGPAQMFISCLTYNLVYNLMSNHSAEHPNGILSANVLKSQYGITQSPSGALMYVPGTERIPYNWYRRPIGQEYDNKRILPDLIEMWHKNPQLLHLGGNIDGVNTYERMNIFKLTKGVYSAASVSGRRDHMMCFVLQAMRILMRSAMNQVDNVALEAMQRMEDFLDGLTCPEMTSVDEGMLERYPGYRRTMSKR